MNYNNTKNQVHQANEKRRQNGVQTTVIMKTLERFTIVLFFLRDSLRLLKADIVKSNITFPSPVLSKLHFFLLKGLVCGSKHVETP